MEREYGYLVSRDYGKLLSILKKNGKVLGFYTEPYTRFVVTICYKRITDGLSQYSLNLYRTRIFWETEEDFIDGLKEYDVTFIDPEPLEQK